MDTDKNYDAFPGQDRSNALYLNLANWVPPENPLAYDDIVKISNCVACDVLNITIQGGTEDCIDAVRGKSLVVENCILQAFGAGVVTIKGSFDNAQINSCTISPGKKRDIELGQFDNYWYPGRKPTRNVTIDSCRTADYKPIRVTLWDADEPKVINSSVKVTRIPKIIWFPYFLFMYVVVRLSGAKTK